MKESIKKRIEAVRRGKVPEGYISENHQLRPMDWQYEKIGKYLVSYDGFSNDTEAYPLATSSRQGLMLQSEYYSDQRYEETSGGFHVVPEGYVTYRHMSDDDIFRFNVNRMGTPVLVSPEYPVFTTSAELNQDLLIAYLNNMKEFTAYCSAQKKGSTRTRMYFSRLGEFSMPIPPVSEQQKIAEILAACDRVIELKQRLLEEKRSQKQWLMQKLLDPNSGTRLPGYIEPWQLHKLGDIMNITSVKRVHQADWTDNGVRFFRARDIVASFNGEEPEDYLFISRDKYDEYSAISGKVSVGDLLVTGVGSIGVPYLVRNTEPLYFKDGNVIWFQNQGRIDGDYFFYAFSGSAIQNYIRDSAGIGTVGTYTIENGKKTPIWLPSEEEQKAIANVINNADREVMLCKKELEAWQRKKKALMQLLLTGLVRVNA